MKKYKVLILGHSNLAKKIIMKTFIKNKIKFCVASKSEKKKIVGAYAQFKSYKEGLSKSLADVVYISLPNSLHYKWAKKALEGGYHVIIDKPMCEDIGKIKNLIKLANKKNRLLSEAIFFNYHRQIPLALKLAGGKKKIKFVSANFIIPKPKINNFRNSKKLKGDVLMDMGSYASSIANIFCGQKFYSKKIIIKRNNHGLINSFNFIFDFSTNIYVGHFKYGGEYQNNLSIYTDKKIINLDRVFSPPHDKFLNIEVKEKNSFKIYKTKKENTFQKYFFEVSKMISNKKFKYYHKKIVDINKFASILKP
tara:strand:+ start:649 stop:1572 length:924 start_codon:yes stop_codon:yes gene_type:complete